MRSGQFDYLSESEMENGKNETNLTEERVAFPLPL